MVKSKIVRLFGKRREVSGNMVLVQMPVEALETLERIEEKVNEDEEYVPAEVVMDKLKIGKKRWYNLFAEGKIKSWMYTTAVNGMKFFHLPSILGIKKRRA